MQKGTDWGGNYSRFSYDETKRYMMMLKEQGVPVLDDEFNVAQETLLNLIRRFVEDAVGNSSPNAGFEIVGTGASNDFTIKGGDGTVDGAGHLYVAGFLAILLSDTTYSGQEVPGPALTTPTADRTDEVYIDIYLDEVGPTADPSIVDPTLNIETNRRWKLFYSVLVAEGSTTPADYTDGQNHRHYTYKLATLARTAQAAITAAMVTDDRAPVQRAHVNGDATQAFDAANAAPGTQQVVPILQADSRYVLQGASTTLSANTVLTASDLNQIIYCNAAITITLPAGVKGARLRIYGNKTASTIKAASGDSLYFGDGVILTSYTFPANSFGEYVDLFGLDGTNWVVFPTADLAVNTLKAAGVLRGALATGAGEAVMWDQVMGLGQTATDQTANRSAGTTYTNSTGKPIFISIRYSISSGSNAAPNLEIDGKVFGGGGSGGTSNGDLWSWVGAPVPSGSSYVFSNASGVTIGHWSEIR